MPLDLMDRLQRFLLFVDNAEINYEETEILEKTVPQMFKVMEKVAKCSCDYVKCGRFGGQSSFSISQMLMIAERTLSGLGHPESIKEMDRELTKVIEDFDRAMNDRLAKETSKHSFQFLNLSIVDPQGLLQGEQSNGFYSSALGLSKPAITANSAVWTAPAKLSSIKSWSG